MTIKSVTFYYTIPTETHPVYKVCCPGDTAACPGYLNLPVLGETCGDCAKVIIELKDSALIAQDCEGVFQRGIAGKITSKTQVTENGCPTNSYEVVFEYDDSQLVDDYTLRACDLNTFSCLDAADNYLQKQIDCLEIVPPGTYSFNVSADSGPLQTITDGETLEFEGDGITVETISPNKVKLTASGTDVPIVDCGGDDAAYVSICPDGNEVTIDSASFTGLATAALQTTGNTSLNSIDTKLSSQATAANQTTQITSLQLLDDVVATDGSAAVTKLFQVGGTDGTNAQILSTDTTGKINVNNVSGTISLPTGAATATNQVTQITSLQLLDDVVATDGSAAVTKLFQVGGTDGTNAQILSTDTSGRLNINNVAGTVSLPTGASTAANQASEIALLTTIAAATPPASIHSGFNLTATPVSNLLNAYKPVTSTTLTGVPTSTVLHVTGTNSLRTGDLIKVNSGTLANGELRIIKSIDSGTQFTMESAYAAAPNNGDTIEVYRANFILSDSSGSISTNIGNALVSLQDYNSGNQVGLSHGIMGYSLETRSQIGYAAGASANLGNGNTTSILQTPGMEFTIIGTIIRWTNADGIYEYATIVSIAAGFTSVTVFPEFSSAPANGALVVSFEPDIIQTDGAGSIYVSINGSLPPGSNLLGSVNVAERSAVREPLQLSGAQCLYVDTAKPNSGYTDGVATLAFGGVTTTYATIATLSGDPRLVSIDNALDKDVMLRFPFDGAIDSWYVKAGTIQLLPVGASGCSWGAGALKVRSVGANATSGQINISILMT